MAYDCIRTVHIKTITIELRQHTDYPNRVGGCVLKRVGPACAHTNDGKISIDKLRTIIVGAHVCSIFERFLYMRERECSPSRDAVCVYVYLNSIQPVLFFFNNTHPTECCTLRIRKQQHTNSAMDSLPPSATRKTCCYDMGLFAVFCVCVCILHCLRVEQRPYLYRRG